MRSSTVISVLVSLCCTVQSGHAWSTTPKSNINNQPHHQVSRKSVLQTLVQGGVATAAVSLLVENGSVKPVWAVEKLNTGVSVEVVKEGKGAKPEIGQLVAIRFAAYADGRKIDDIFDTPEPYYTRLGSGGLLKGVESTLPLMTLGDRWKLTIPGELAFGPKGRPASAGKPRIPGNAEVVFDVEIVGLPGKEPELIDLIGDD